MIGGKWLIVLNILRSFLHNIFKIFQFFIFNSVSRKKYRIKILSLLFLPSKKEIETTIPIMSYKETIQYIVDNKCSISRYGDGEIYYFLTGKKHYFQPRNKELRLRLKHIISNPQSSCLVALPCWANQYYNEYDTYTGYQISSWYRLLPYLKSNYNYGNAHCFCFRENTDVSLIKQLWQDREVILVTGKNSAFIWDMRLFDNCKRIDTIYTKAIDAYSDYDNILNKIQSHNDITPNTLFFLSIGLTATVLAYDLSKLGYQALDMGHISNYFLTALGEAESITQLRDKKKYIDGAINIEDIIK